MKKIKQKFLWSIRRYCLPIPPKALVLEVGSGGNPYPRSNVLVDAYEESQERHWDKLIHDRPTVLAYGENLPFKDKVFDYVIAAHVLEHTPYPEKFLRELERVSLAGYIETPDAFMERINPYKDHRLEVFLRNDELVINKKTQWKHDENMVELYEHQVKGLMVREVMPKNPEKFHMRYFWKEKIKFRVLNPDSDASWTPPISQIEKTIFLKKIKEKIRLFLLLIIRRLLSQSNRNKNLDIISILRCVVCFSGDLIKMGGRISCKHCGADYAIKKNIYLFKI